MSWEETDGTMDPMLLEVHFSEVEIQVTQNMTESRNEKIRQKIWQDYHLKWFDLNK